MRTRIAAPLGLDDLHVGLPRHLHDRLADIVHVGDEPTDAELGALDFPAIPKGEATEDALQGFNDPAMREVRVPGGGGVMTAGDLALFYQAFVADGRAHDGTSVWSPSTVRASRAIRTGELIDPWFRKRANRGLGIIVAGDADRTYRGFGKTGSALTFGHNGAGGQLAWGDPRAASRSATARTASTGILCASHAGASRFPASQGVWRAQCPDFPANE